MSALTGLIVCLAVGGPATAAVSVKPDAPPDSLGHCAVTINRWNAIAKAHGRTPEPEYVERLAAIMAFSKTHTGDWSQTFSAALRAQIARYDAMTDPDRAAAMQKDILDCEAFLDADSRPNALT